MTKRKLHINSSTKKLNKRGDVDLSVDDTDPGTSFTVYNDKATSNSYRIYFPQEIEGDLSIYHELIEYFRDAKKIDHITVYLQCWGGSCEVGTCLASAMRECVATIEVRVVGNCYSMGAMLALCGDSLVLTPSTFLMFHNYSWGVGGKGGEVKLRVKETDRAELEMMKALCYPFLTEKELDRLSKDQDLYIHSTTKSLKSRCLRHFPQMKIQDKAGKKKR